MMHMRRLVFMAVCLAVSVVRGGAQTCGGTQAPAMEEAEERSWSGSGSIFTYVLPDEENFVQPTAAVDHAWLHLEVRFNYEDLDTASVWAGRTFTVGERLALEITPMGGAVFGNTNGVALGYAGSFAWRQLDVSSETEYVFASGDAESFLYTWSELGWSPAPWFRGGLSVQRTKVYQTEFDIQRGFFGAFTAGRWEFSTYVFNPDADDPTFVFGVALAF
jgi:hypothetical protein